MSTFTVSSYLINRLHEIGVGHLFGVPGDYVLDFLDHVVASQVTWVGTCNELNAGYAADGYARVNGVGAAVVTYGVGGLSILNTAAGAYAEQVPMIVISGAPPTSSRKAGAMVHHLVSNYDLQFDVYEKLTIDSIVLSDADSAPAKIDRALKNCLTNKLPVYIEIPADIAVAECRQPEPMEFIERKESDPAALRECIAEVVALLDKADNPMLLAGVELHRFGLGDETLKLIEKAEIPYATMFACKSILPELHPQFAGVYLGGLES